GLGCVLATQNPVDLDYKGLANCGTWFLGRLQTERDKLRVLDGLEGASASAGASFDRATMERTLAGLAKRVFLLHNVHADTPQLFQTRWALSYLRGPLTKNQIATLMSPRKPSGSAGNTGLQPGSSSSLSSSAASSPPRAPPNKEASQEERAGLEPGVPGGTRPPIPAGIAEHFLPAVRDGARRYAP